MIQVVFDKFACMPSLKKPQEGEIYFIVGKKSLFLAGVLSLLWRNSAQCKVIKKTNRDITKNIVGN